MNHSTNCWGFHGDLFAFGGADTKPTTKAWQPEASATQDAHEECT